MKNILAIIMCFNMSSLLAQHHTVICNSYQVIFGSDPVCNNNQWVLVFEDNFNGDKLDEKKWRIPYQGVVRDYPGDSEKQWYANSGTTPAMPMSNNIEVSNGTLKLIARKESTPITGTVVTNWGTNPPSTQTYTYDYSSAQIESFEKFNFGKYEIRCKIPKGKGFWPAFWTYGDPQMNEIDVFEFWNEPNCYGNYDPSRLAKNPHFNIHNDSEADGSAEDCNSELCRPCFGGDWDGPDFSEDFHVFTMTWDYYKIDWFIDNVLIRRTTRLTDIFNGASRDCSDLVNGYVYMMVKSFPGNQDVNILANLAIKSGGEAPDATTVFPNQYEIDYIRYYKQVPCVGNVVKNNTSELGLTSPRYSTVIGKTVTMQSNVTIGVNQQLKVIGVNEISFKPGFSSINSSHLQAFLDPSICYTALTPNNTIEEFQDPAILDASLSLEESDNNNFAKIYPNPTNGKVFIEMDEKGIGICYVTISDPSGHTILTKNFTDKIELDLSAYGSGIYFVKVYDNQSQKILVDKVVKQP